MRAAVGLELQHTGHAGTMSALVLDPVEGAIGSGDEVLARSTVAGECGNTDGGGDGDGTTPLGLERPLLERREDASRNRLGRLGIGVRQDDGEFVSPVPSGHVQIGRAHV